MSAPLLDLQAKLAPEIPLLRYAPSRVRFEWKDWNPASVRSCTDLPQYLVLGPLDGHSFSQGEQGWKARWQGTEADTHFDVAYRADTRRWEVSQTWCGVSGGWSVFPVAMSLDKVIGQALNLQFPASWDQAAREQLEAAYQLNFVAHPKEAFSFFGIPDGNFRSIAIPIAIPQLRPIRQWLRQSLAVANLSYPVKVEAKRVFQAVNYLEGKAPEWTTQEAVTFCQSLDDTGLVPYGFPAREVAGDSSVAWTLRRDIYFVFIGVPFAGLTDFLARIASSDGPIRRTADPQLRGELRPLLLPVAFEAQVPEATFWDAARTTRSYLQFRTDGRSAGAKSVEQFIALEEQADQLLDEAESISAQVTQAIGQIFQKSTDGSST